MRYSHGERHHRCWGSRDARNVHGRHLGSGLGLPLVRRMNSPHHRLQRMLTHLGLRGDFAIGASEANEVWVGETIVIRINTRGDGSLLREATLAARLAPEVRYPELLDAGTLDELTFTITRRVPGICLAHAWPTMDEAARQAAFAALLDALTALHATDPTGLPGDDEVFGPHVLPPTARLPLARSGFPDTDALLAEVEGFLRTPLPRGPQVVAHGDPHLENAMVDQRFTALLDLEWARPTWREVDVEILLSFAADPAWFVIEAYEERSHPADYADVPRWIAERTDWLDGPGIVDRVAQLHCVRHARMMDVSVPWDRDDPRDRRNALHHALLRTGPVFDPLLRVLGHR
ncbi:MAG: phosphotransferase [Myxococcota bacterium]